MDWVLQYWVQVSFGLIITSIGVLYRKLVKYIKRNDATALGVQALLRDRLIQSYNHYTEKGFCPIYARDNAQNMYEQYHALGGNGTITGLVNKLMTLPTESENDKRR